MQEKPKEKSEEDRKKYYTYRNCTRMGITEEMKKTHPKFDEKGLEDKFYDLLDEVIFFLVFF